MKHNWKQFQVNMQLFMTEILRNYNYFWILLMEALDLKNASALDIVY